MAKPARFTPKKTADGWRVNVPAKFSESGKRERHFFRTRQLAEDAAAEMKIRASEYGRASNLIPPTLAEQAAAAQRLLAPLGITVLEAAQRIAKIEKKARASVPIDEALAKFREAGEWSQSQNTAYRLLCEKLKRSFQGRKIATIQGEELRRHIEATTNGPAAYNAAIRLTKAIWRWCAKPPRKWCGVEAIEHLDTKETQAKEIGTLTARECRALLHTAETHFPECVAPFAIALFTGIRQAELERLRPSDITPEGITVPAAFSKTKRRRFIDMPAPLADWLAAYPIGEEVCPTGWKRKEKAVRRLAGWSVWSNLAPTIDARQSATPPAEMPAWPPNALRHTAATCAVALGKPIEALLFEHGHSGGVALMKKHYLGLMPKTEAAAIWAIRPHGKSAPLIAAV